VEKSEGGFLLQSGSQIAEARDRFNSGQRLIVNPVANHSRASYYRREIENCRINSSAMETLPTQPRRLVLPP
jgi:hypothetical protein